MLIDTHCHFDFPPFIDEISSSIMQYQQAGVSKIIVPAVSQHNFSRIMTLANTHRSVYCALGLHPIYAHQQHDLQYLSDQLAINSPKLVAIGEIGLDGYIEGANIEQQIHFFSAQLDLAKQYHLPVILHSRKAHSQLYKTLKQAKLTNSGVIHGFSGSYEEAMQFIRLGFRIGVGGVISYERAKKTRHAISQIPLDSIVLETDAPDMPLSGQQGQPNRPENILVITQYLSSLRSEKPSRIIEQIGLNTLDLFPKLNAN